ncbi:MAG: SPFH domain-containing protein, partial [Promethearchaeota archaeon]
MALDAIIIGVLVVVGFALLWLVGGFRVAMEYERLVIFRFGRYKRTIGPGIVYILPVIEKAKKIDM